jgi:hypothetical protein
MSEYQLFIDESCHLENDKQTMMAMGLIRVNKANSSQLKSEFMALAHAYKTPTELKWNSISKSRLPFYQALIDLFMRDNGVLFRAITIKNKDKLDHDAYKRTHHQFYYVVAYELLKNEYVLPMLDQNQHRHRYEVFFDFKDTRGKERLIELETVLKNKFKKQSAFVHFQHLHSHDNFWIQLTDFLLGAVTFKSRGLHLALDASPAKKEVLTYLEHAIGYSLSDGTPPWEPKFNIFDFQLKNTKG